MHVHFSHFYENFVLDSLCCIYIYIFFHDCVFHEILSGIRIWRGGWVMVVLQHHLILVPPPGDICHMLLSAPETPTRSFNDFDDLEGLQPNKNETQCRQKAACLCSRDSVSKMLARHRPGPSVTVEWETKAAGCGIKTAATCVGYPC